MHCPHCSKDSAVLVKDCIAVSEAGSAYMRHLHPGEPPSKLGGLFLGGGVALVVLAFVLGNMSGFRDAFWNYGASRMGGLGWFVLWVIGLTGAGSATYGFVLGDGRSDRLAQWERKRAFSERGLVCPTCMKAWLQGLEEHSIDLS